MERAQKISEEFSKASGFKDFMEAQKKAEQATREANEETKKRTVILSDLEKAEKRLKAAQSEQAVEVQKVRVETENLNRENKQAAKEALGLVDAYSKFGKQVSEAKREAKNLGAQMILLEQDFKKSKISSKEYETEIGRLSQQYTEAQLRASGLDAQIKKLDNSVGDNQRKVGNYENAVKGIGSAFKGAIAAFGVISAIDMFADISRQSYETIKLLNAQNTALLQVFETEAQVARQKEYLADITDRYGLEIVSITDGYTKYSAAVKGTSLEGEKARLIFESFSGASAKLGLSADQNTGIFRALEQMISKGKIQAEELRGQIGDRMPGAFSLFAAAMGVSTAELDKMLKNGEVLSEDVLPKVAQQLNEVYNLDNSTKVDTLAAAQNRLKNEWTDFLNQIAGNKELINGLANTLEFMGNILNYILDVLVVRGSDGISVVSELTDVITALVDMLSFGGGAANEADEDFKPFIGTLIHAKNVVMSLVTVVTYLGETVANVGYGLSHLDLEGFHNRMDAAAERFLAKVDLINKSAEHANYIMNAEKSEGEIFAENERKKTESYKNAWNQAKAAKQAYFQFEGKYFSGTTGKNTGKSTDDYIDRGGKLVAKPKNAAVVSSSGSADSDAKKAQRESERLQKQREREAEQAARLAFQSAKAEIEAKKLALDFTLKAFDQEKATTTEKQLFYQNYYAEKLRLLREEGELEARNAKTAGERSKLEQKYKNEAAAIEKEKAERVHAATVEAANNEVSVYALKNRSLLENALDLSDELIQNEKNRILTILDLEINALNQKYRLLEDEVQAKLDAGEQLTTAEIEYLEKVQRAREQARNDTDDIDSEYYGYQRKHLENMIKYEELARGDFYENDIELRQKHAEDVYNIEMENLKKLLADKKITQQEFDDQAKISEKELEKEKSDIRMEAFSKAIDKQSEFVEEAGAIKQLGLNFEKMINATTTEDYMSSLADQAGALKSFAKEGSATWKALALLQATLNMAVGISQAIKEPFPINIAMIALNTATGIMAIAKIQSTKVPAYEKGTLFAEKSGLAITDEKGAELHFDKDWNLKDKGSASGPRFKQVERGDKILPAEMSKMINHMQLPVSEKDHPETVDYERISDLFARKTARLLKRQKQRFFMLDKNDEIVKVEATDNTQTVYRNRPNKPTGQKLR